jgi:hypothetical protein
MISMALSRLLRDLCPSYAEGSQEFGRRIPYMSTPELLEAAQLESALMTGEVDRWIAEHPGSGVTRAGVEEHLAFLRDALVPAMRATDAVLRPPMPASDPSSNGSSPSAAAGMADLLAMCERISQIEAAEHGALADSTATVRYLDRLIESLLGCAARLRALRNRYEAADDRRS